MGFKTPYDHYTGHYYSEMLSSQIKKDHYSDHKNDLSPYLESQALERGMQLCAIPNNLLAKDELVAWANIGCSHV